MIAFSIQSSAPPTLNRDIHRGILREEPLSLFADKSPVSGPEDDGPEGSLLHRGSSLSPTFESRVFKVR